MVLTSNFQHLTGIRLSPKRFRHGNDFYKRCLYKTLEKEDIQSISHFAPVKIQELPELLRFDVNGSSIAEFDNDVRGITTTTDKVIPSLSNQSFIGFLYEFMSEGYVANTVIKNPYPEVVIGNPEPIVAIFKKRNGTIKYTYCTKLSPSFDLFEQKTISTLKDFVDFENLTFAPQITKPPNLSAKQSSENQNEQTVNKKLVKKVKDSPKRLKGAKSVRRR
jgi:hypothetical protein